MVARLEVASTRQVLATNVETAGSFRQRLVGLIGRRALDEGNALLFERARQVHTFGMRFPIDVVFCDATWTVVRIVANMRPARVTRIVTRARFVLELPAGAASGLKPGDRLMLG